MQAPADEDLRGRLVVFRRERLDDWVGETGRVGAHDRGIGLDDDPVGFAVLHDIALLTPWVEFDLVDGGDGGREGFEVFDPAAG